MLIIFRTVLIEFKSYDLFRPLLLFSIFLIICILVQTEFLCQDEYFNLNPNCNSWIHKTCLGNIRYFVTICTIIYSTFHFKTNRISTLSNYWDNQQSFQITLLDVRVSVVYTPGIITLSSENKLSTWLPGL